MSIKVKQLKLDAKTAVNGAWVDIPGYPGLRYKIAHFRLVAWQEWCERRAGDFESSDELERAFYGSEIIRGVEGLDDDEGKPIQWTPETGEKLLTQHEVVNDERTGEDVKVFPFEAMFFWVRNFSQDATNFGLGTAGN